MKKRKSEYKRPYTTDYGISQGHCATPQGAIKSAIRHLMESGSRKCVIEQKDGGPPIDVWYNGYWGVIVSPRRAKSNVVQLATRKKA